MDIKEIKAKIKTNQYVYTHHAEIERRVDELKFSEIEEALLNREILEQYPDTGRGESCLIVGFAGDLPIHDEKSNMRKVKCNFCGSNQYEERRIDYLYSYKGKYLLVPNTPIEVCLNCGMVYYDAAVLKEIERRFFAIHQNIEQPDRYIEMPSKAYA